MNIIIPMAGRGTRMRPHSLTIPKPLIPIAGKPIAQRLVEDIAGIAQQKIDNIGFVIHPSFGKDVEEHLKQVAAQLGAKGHVYYQEKALGTAHAIQCAQDLLEGNCIVAFADTLFKADFKLDNTKDGIIWVQKVENPKPFGVVKVNADGNITDFVEKPQEFISDLAIIGIYYFKDGAWLRKEIQHLLDNDIKDKGEYQITNALENMKQKGAQLVPGQVDEWLDCGNKDVTVYTNQRYLEFIKDKELVAKSAKIENSVVIPPCYIGENVVLNNSVIGPYVSIGTNTKIVNSRIENSIIQENTSLKDLLAKNSMIGNHVIYEGRAADLSVGDYNVIKE
ncbi:sugar phosphate nucleotidyltransferase [Cesiribacter sp. SM1]|uniref:sugar phosphate nucleotidyltransferase n=1 Tax=Cesiribacter sp. SM1 TaxID=2861196 RepID=UPI001CD7236D|nr:sugar phosphate nucleotidyltransferase [Cesiribacter sp. SM1]